MCKYISCGTAFRRPLFSLLGGINNARFLFRPRKRRRRRPRRPHHNISALLQKSEPFLNSCKLASIYDTTQPTFILRGRPAAACCVRARGKRLRDLYSILRAGILHKGEDSWASGSTALLFIYFITSAFIYLVNKLPKDVATFILWRAEL